MLVLINWELLNSGIARLCPCISPEDYKFSKSYLAKVYASWFKWGSAKSTWSSQPFSQSKQHYGYPATKMLPFSCCACVLSHFSHVWLFATLWTVAHQAALSMGFSRQEYYSRLPCPPPGDLPHPGIEPTSLTSPALAGWFWGHHLGSPHLAATVRQIIVESSKAGEAICTLHRGQAETKKL